jgi:nicotinamidase-related amidase
MQPTLLLIDIQNDYFPGGAMEVHGAEGAAANAALLLAEFRARSLPVVHVQHQSTRPGATYLLPGTTGGAIHSSVAPVAAEPVFQKHFPNSFRGTLLLEHLQSQGIIQLVVAGMMTHMCIDTTVRAAADLGFACTLAHDACATRALSFGGTGVPAEAVQAAYLAGMNGMFARVMATRDIIATL